MVIHSPLFKEAECLQSTLYLVHSRNKRSFQKTLSEVSAVPGHSAHFWRLCLCNNHRIRSKKGWCGHSWTRLVRVCVCVCMWVLSHSVVSDSLWPHGLQPARLLCPWDTPGKNIEVSCRFLLQGIFPTQDSWVWVSMQADVSLQADSLLSELLRNFWKFIGMWSLWLFLKTPYLLEMYTENFTDKILK